MTLTRSRTGVGFRPRARGPLQTSIVFLVAIVVAACQGTAAPSSDAPASGPAATAAPASAASEISGDLSMITGFNTAVVPLVEASLDEFRAKFPNVNLTVEHVTEGRLEKTDIALAAGTAPDVIVYNAPELFDRAEGALLPIDDLIAADSEFDLSVLNAGAVQGNVINGKLYGLPGDTSTQVLYYNKDVFDAAGEPYPTADWTWDTWSDTAIRLTRDEQYGNYFSWPINDGGWGHEYYYWQAGAELVNEARTEWTAVGPEAERALQFLVDLQTKGSTPLDSEIGFSQGNVAMMISGQWWFPGLREEVTFNWDVAPVPAGPGPAGESVWTTGSAWSINAATKNPAAAWELVKWVTTNPGYQRAVYGDSGLSVPALTEVGATAWLAPTEAGLPPENSQVVLDTLEGARPVTSFPNQDLIWSQYTEAVDSVLLGQKTVSQALNDLKVLADAAIAEGG